MHIGPFLQLQSLQRDRKVETYYSSTVCSTLFIVLHSKEIFTTGSILYHVSRLGSEHCMRKPCSLYREYRSIGTVPCAVDRFHVLIQYRPACKNVCPKKLRLNWLGLP